MFEVAVSIGFSRGPALEFGNIKLSFSMVFTAHPSVYQGELNMNVVHLKFLIRDSNRFKHRVIIRSNQ